MNRLGSLPVSVGVTPSAAGTMFVPASAESPFHSKPASACGEIRALYETTPKGFTPVAPEPRKFKASPVGRRTSTPAATANRSPLYTVYFPRRTTSPIPAALPESENLALRHGTCEAHWEVSTGLVGLKECHTLPGAPAPAGAAELGTIVACELTAV